MRPTIFAAIVAAVVLLSISCAAVQPRTKDDIPRSNLLPLANGWYQYDFTRTFRNIETEQAFAAAGVELRQEITFRYTVAPFGEGRSGIRRDIPYDRLRIRQTAISENQRWVLHLELR